MNTVSIVSEIQRSSDFDLNNYLSQSIQVKSKNFAKYNDAFSVVFGEHEDLHLSRQDVFNRFNECYINGMLSAVAWGFQKGTMPGGRSLEPFLDNLKNLEEILKEISINGLNKKSFNEINSFKGVKNGITTKLMYFASNKINDCPCLIYDSRVKMYLETLRPNEFSKTLSFIKKWQNVPTYELYKSYCTEAYECAKSLDLSAGAIEMFMFSKAPNRNKPLHKIG